MRIKTITTAILDMSRLCTLRLCIIGVALVAAASAMHGAPAVNGLFYGDGDQHSYVLHNTSVNGSTLWYTVAGNRLYAALVVDRSVNDNVFCIKKPKDYTSSAGWNPHRTAKRLMDSEFAAFTLTVGEQTFEWRQGYAQKIDGLWQSSHTTGKGSGTPPPGYESASSMTWNLNQYFSNPAPAWNMFVDGSSPDDWKSPFDPAQPDNVIGLEGYPAEGPITFSPTYQWEWAMVYEWSVDLSEFGSNPIFVISGASHHSPSKLANDIENDIFPDPEPGSNQYLSDYGDLPAPYPTLLADNGACHYIVPNTVLLGSLLDPEIDGLPHPEALGDDQMGSADEDGVTLVTLAPNAMMTLNLTISAPGYLSAFFDFNAAGTLNTGMLLASAGPAELAAGEISDLFFPQAGTYTLMVAAPQSSTQPIAARFRVTNNANEGGASPSGVAISGEVEDYIFEWDDRGSLSASVELNVYAEADGTVMLELNTVDEDGSSDIVIYALINDDWVEVGRVSSDEVYGSGSNSYTVIADGLDVGNEYQFKVVDESGNKWVTANKRVEQRVRTARVHNLKVNSSTLSLTFETEPGARYIVKVSESLGADAQWEIENVQIAHPVFPSGFSQAMQEVPGAPGTQTTVRMQRNRKCAFFKVIRLD